MSCFIWSFNTGLTVISTFLSLWRTDKLVVHSSKNPTLSTLWTHPLQIPYFIEELQISNIDLGTEVPVIRRANKPYLDENGFWVDLDVTYSGKFKMTIETKVNLLKLKKPVSAQPSAEREDSEK